MDKKELALKLFEVGAVKFGSFTLKSGMVSPFYLDMRLLVSYPMLLQQVGELIWEKTKGLAFDLVCGVPYTALPIATCFSVSHTVPMVMRRKEQKNYGTRKMVEGVFQKGQTCLVIEDIVTTGGSVLETVQSLQEEGLKVCDAAVIIDREQGGRENLKAKQIELHALLKISEVFAILQKTHKIDEKTLQQALHFLAGASS